MYLTLFTDGGSRGNPGPAASGFVVFAAANDSPLSASASSTALSQSSAVKVLEKCGNYLGVTTNNQAEYAALIAGLTWIQAHHPTANLDIRMDSLLIVNQVKGLYKIKSPELLPKNLEVRAILAKFAKYSISYVPRAQNAVADTLVNQALDAQMS